MADENDIQKLLRLKRHEQPSPEYFENFLKEFQNRQRAELLRRSMWQLTMERISLFLEQQSFGRKAYGYATAVALLMIVGVSTLQVNNAPVPKGAIAAVPAAHSPIHVAQNTPHAPVAPGGFEQRGTPVLGEGFTNDAVAEQKQLPPYYVIDAQPVSYEPPFSF